MKTTILPPLVSAVCKSYKMMLLLFIIPLLLALGCKKEDDASTAEAIFSIIHNYKVLGPTSIQVEGELVFTESGTFKSHGYVWSETNPTPTLSDHFTDLGEISGSGKVKGTIDGLEYGKVFFYRGYAKAGKDRIFYSGTLKASTAWQPIESPSTNPLRDGVSMVIGNKAYIGLGATSFDFYQAGNQSAMWEFNNTSNQWVGKKQFPNGGREESFSFAINGKGYVGGGFSGTISGVEDYSIVYKDFWEFDPAANQWTLIGELPGNLHRIGFEIGGYGYCFNKSSFYRYDPASNEWSQLSIGFTSRIWTTSFVVNGKAYLVGGMNSSNEPTDEVLEFDPVTQVWTKKANFPGGPVTEAVSFVINNQVYFGTGFTGDYPPFKSTDNFWRYDPGNDAWERAESIPYGRQGGLAFSVGNRAFVGGGGDAAKARNDWWEYIPFK